MALPASLSTATVTGTYVSILGNPISGSITFQPQTILKETNANVIIMPTYITKTFDANGTFTVVLPCTNDTDISPQPYAYTVVENFTNGRTFQMTLPLSQAGLTVNMADILPALSSTSAGSYTTIDQYSALKIRVDTQETVPNTVLNSYTLAETAAVSEASALAAYNGLESYQIFGTMLMGS
jgi:hypothetical protein